MGIETECLVLRRWVDDDAADFYEQVGNPDVGPVAGWPVRRSVENGCPFRQSPRKHAIPSGRTPLWSMLRRRTRA